VEVDKIKPSDMYEARKFLHIPPKAVIYTICPKKYVLPEERSMGRNGILLAHKAVVAEYPDALLLLLGGESEDWIADARFMGIDKHIIKVGFQPVDQYSLFLSASNFFLFPIGGSEGTVISDRARSPLRVVEYMAAGRPIITTTLPEIKNDVDGCGLFIKSGRSSDLAEGILYAIRNPDLCKKMGELARERAVKLFSWSSIAQQLESAYYQILGREDGSDKQKTDYSRYCAC
jgi:glycosyltransferase involved in cell wall biosynthesis